MSESTYPIETLSDSDDDGTMPSSVEELRAAVIGRRIVSAEKSTVPAERYGRAYDLSGLVLTLDDGRRVCLSDTDDCCAYTELTEFLLHPERTDHVITGVGTTDGYMRWHIYADIGDVLELGVGWSCGNPFFYGYGFNILVKDA